jgi:hypothetical protein
MKSPLWGLVGLAVLTAAGNLLALGAAVAVTSWVVWVVIG